MKLASLSPRICVGALVLALPCSSAFADDSLPIGFSWSHDGEDLTVTISAFEDIEDLEMEVRPSQGRTRNFDRSSLDNGESWAVEFDLPTATTTYEVRVEGECFGDDGLTIFEFEVEGYSALELEADPTREDIISGHFTMRANTTVELVEIVVIGEGNTELGRHTLRPTSVEPGEDIHVRWPVPSESVMKVDVEALAAGGSTFAYNFIPWQVEFDPVYINFESGSAELPEADLEMLRSRLIQLNNRAGRVRDFIDVQLYVGGYTDTVGSAADNRALSEARARALATFLRSEGLTIPVLYQGFGESALAVPTADNVDEAQNRRALFVLGAGEPSGSPAYPTNRWRSLR